MNKKILLLVNFILLSSSLAFSENDKISVNENLKEVQKNLISNHIEYAKTSIDRRCHSLKRKIKKCEDQLHYLETSRAQNQSTDESQIDKHRINLIDKIQKYENQIDNLKLLKVSSEVINFNKL